MRFIVLIMCSLIFAIASCVEAASPVPIDLSKAVVVRPANATPRERRAVKLLVDEVEKRTGFRWKTVEAAPESKVPQILVGQYAEIEALLLSGVVKSDQPASSSAALSSVIHFVEAVGKSLSEEADRSGPEGFRLATRETPGSEPAVLLLGKDERGILFGCGRLLRELRMTGGAVSLDGSIDIRSSPAQPLRGHQLGYRPKTNSYDAWTPEIWEQYIADLAVFGTNAIELIPPRSDDADQSPHFPLPKIDMMERMSKIADDFGLDVWVWYPAMDRDYSKPETVEFALKEWAEVFNRLPRIDAIFVPGGDPGHTQPKYLLKLLEKQTESLHQHHPKAQMWVSPQSFDEKWLQEFLGILRDEQPKWLSGVVFGPQNRNSLADLRKQVPPQYAIRHYPDITHSLRAQYGVPDWDLAYAMTENREVIDPRPMAEAQVFHLTYKDTVGFLTYSEGCNDDVNKIVWSSLGWDPSANAANALRQYARYFIGADFEEEFARGLLALEENWRGPLLTHESVYTTLQQFQAMERRASPKTQLNWRFQQGLFRAYFDAYERARLIEETASEERAMEILRRAGALGSSEAIRAATEILDAGTANVAPEWRTRIFQLAEALFQSIRMQLSVPLYKAIAVDRGAHLDLIDYPLNNGPWLKAQFAKMNQLPSELQKLEEIHGIVDWTNPGPGGFYDDLGNVASQPHLVRGPGWDTDPEFRKSARTGFRIARGERTSWMRFAESTYGAPLEMRYENLNPAAQYKVRVIYGDPTTKAKLRLMANANIEIHPFIDKAPASQPAEFEIPREATRDGVLTLSWTAEPGHGGAGRGCQVAEVWLIKTGADAK